MKTFPRAFLSVALWLGASSAYSFNVCELKTQTIPVTSASPEEIGAYQTKLNLECDLYQNYVGIREKARGKFEIGLERISLYQAMRFIRRVDYEFSKAKEIPIEITYQILQADYTKPMNERSSKIWDNWVAGIAQLLPEVEKVKNGEEFTFEQLRDVHRGFFTLSDEVGDFAHRPDPGQMKPPTTGDLGWWKFGGATEATNAQDVIQKLNAKYEAMNLVATVKGAKDAAAIRYPLHIELVDGVYWLHSGDSRANPQHIANLFKFINSMMDQARRGQHLVWNGHLMTPVEVAFFAQQFYVQIHPFSEGNGRTSRFLQELILRFYDFPHGSSGDLMDSDVLTSHEAYYQQAFTSMNDEINRVGHCVDDYHTQLRFSRKKIWDVSPENMEYDCRILK